ncbi:MAG TPA: glycoside hydrolase family 16 protein [Candidatus Microsaccharimonas sp.]
MNHAYHEFVSRTHRKVVNTLKRWRHDHARHPELAQRSVLIFSAALFGLIIAFFQIIPILHAEQTPLSIATPAAPSPAKEADPTQHNSLFATHPSWSQNFTTQTSGLPDPLYWNVLVGPAENSNSEQQYYSDSNANLRLNNSGLHLIGTHQSQPGGYQYGSARLETQGKQSFLYGRIDISAKLPSGSGTWPALWLLPANNTYANKSPKGDALRYRNGGEIDIMESVGFQPDLIYGVAHTLSDSNLRSDGTGSYKTVKVPGSSTSFNTYTVLWTPTTITFAVNDVAYFTYARQAGANYTTWPFDQPFYLIANLALGGTWGGMDTAHFPDNGIDNNALPASFDIASIYYYSYIGSTDVK